MVCKKCGEPLHSDDTFCKKCAASIYDVVDIDEITKPKQESLNISKLNSLIKFNPETKYKVSKQTVVQGLDNKNLITRDQNDRVKASIINIGGTVLILIVFIVIVVIILSMLF